MNTLKFLIFFNLIILSSCQSDKLKEAPKLSTQEKSHSTLSTLIDDTGILNLQLNNASWEEVHDNYLQSVNLYSSHPKLLTYKQHVILYQIEKTSILNDVTPKKVEILKTYLKDLEVSHYGYPKVHYLLLSVLSPFLEHEELIHFAKSSYQKGIREKGERKKKIDHVLNSNEREEVKKSYENSFQENYIEYLPKLKEFFTEE